MPSTVVYDMSDGGVKKMVDSWADDTEYTGMVTVKTGSGAQRNVCEVTSFEPHGMEGETDDEADRPTKKDKTPMKEKPSMKVEY